jgi:hypothetical protein
MQRAEVPVELLTDADAMAEKWLLHFIKHLVGSKLGNNADLTVVVMFGSKQMVTQMENSYGNELVYSEAMVLPSSRGQPSLRRQSSWPRRRNLR